MKTKTILIIALLLAAGQPLQAQQLSLATNAVEYFNMGALNGEVAVSLGTHLSLAAGAAYNPWNYGSEENGYLQNRQRNFSIGMRYWPWHTYSGTGNTTGADSSATSSPKKEMPGVAAFPLATP